jgi:Holliday junction DNA helicase RuvA
MIGRLRGQVIERTSTMLLVDVHDVGYVVNVSPQCKFGVGDRAELHIHTHVREDALSLYGFSDALEREVFDLLITVPSIGPVKAMQILATPAIELIEAVIEKNPNKLSRLPGVGKKTAERMVVDLHDKMTTLRPRAAERFPSIAATAPKKSAVLEDLISAMVNLGFRPAIADEAATSAVKRLGEDAGLQPLLKDALIHAGNR